MTCIINVIGQINEWSRQLDQELYYDKLTVILKVSTKFCYYLYRRFLNY